MIKTPVQTSLFSTEKILPEIKGLNYIPHYINESEEKSLLQIIDKQIWITELKRRVQHYGYKYDYKARKITSDMALGQVPEWLNKYCLDLSKEGYFRKTPDQVIVNEYEPGQGISAHVDCIPCFGDTIASLSLGSDCVMQFTSIKTNQKTSMLLESRSLVLLSGEARYNWRHSIPAKKTEKINGTTFNRSRRISLTFRNVIRTY